MRVKTHNGVTECRLEDFVAVEPKLAQIREDFRAGKIDEDAVFVKVRALFGPERFHRDFDAFFDGQRSQHKYGWGYPSDALKRWEDHVNETKTHKLYYSNEVVSGLITQEAK